MNMEGAILKICSSTADLWPSRKLLVPIMGKCSWKWESEQVIILSSLWHSEPEEFSSRVALLRNGSPKRRYFPSKSEWLTEAHSEQVHWWKNEKNFEKRGKSVWNRWHSIGESNFVHVDEELTRSSGCPSLQPKMRRSFSFCLPFARHSSTGSCFLAT